MSGIDPEFLTKMARRYVWWKTPAEAISMPDRVIAQVMDLGDWDDVQGLAARAGEAGLRRVLAGAEAGQFNPRSWAYWHHRLGMAPRGEVPPAPARRTG